MALSTSLLVLDLRHLDIKIFPYLKKKENLCLTKSVLCSVCGLTKYSGFLNRKCRVLKLFDRGFFGGGGDRFHHSREKNYFLGFEQFSGLARNKSTARF